VTQRALLIAIMEPAPSMEEEFNDWYDLEHLPQMRAVPGIDTATRFVAVEGWPRYLAIYDLKDFAVLRSDHYRAMTGTHFTAWSRRNLARVKGWQRLTFIQASPGDAVIHDHSSALSLSVFSGRPDLGAAAGALAREPGVIQARAFGPGEETNDGAALVVESGAIGALSRPSPEQLTVKAGQLVFSASYVRYTRPDPTSRFHALEQQR
jgi:hypothetical protein